jgi:hypothetical protein
MAVLVLYFVIFVVLIIAAIIAASQSSSDDRRSSSRGGDGGFGWLFWFWGGPSYSSDGYSSRGRASRPKDARPFYKKVFAFVFGPEPAPKDALAEERALLAWIRAMKGRITAADLAGRTGTSLRRAEDRATKLIVDYGGDVEVTEDGTLVYTFKNLLVEGGAKKAEAAPAPAYWARYEAAPELTGNTAGTNGLIIFFNAFNLIAALSAPYFIFPPLGLSGLAAEVGLVYFPAVFSAIFFAVPLLRALDNAKERRRAAGRNLRRAAMDTLYAAAEKRPGLLTPEPAEREIARRYESRAPGGDRLAEDLGQDAPKAELDRLLHDFEGEPGNDSSGRVVYTFDRLSRELAEGAASRKGAAADESRLGAIVYRSDE